jgi:yeast amino acid transporter
MNISTISGYIAWIVVLITYIRFRKAMRLRNMWEQLPFKTAGQPYLAWFVLFLISLLTLTNGFQILIPRNWNVQDFLAAYITIPIFLVLYLGHKMWFRTPFFIPSKDIDCVSGKREMDEMAANDVEPVAKNWLQRVWFWIA